MPLSVIIPSLINSSGHASHSLMYRWSIPIDMAGNSLHLHLHLHRASYSNFSLPSRTARIARSQTPHVRYANSSSSIFLYMLLFSFTWGLSNVGTASLKLCFSCLPRFNQYYFANHFKVLPRKTNKSLSLGIILIVSD